MHPDGIHVQGLRYLDLTLAAYVGERVTIRYDPRGRGLRHSRPIRDPYRIRQPRIGVSIG
jgi:hypothetical protein